jgi:6-pyruvoyltetrahydropterin/6-carboxytetrahydropterin synthase
MLLTREIRFCLAESAGEEDAAVQNGWGGWWTDRLLNPYLAFQVTVAGEPDPRTGMLCNVKVLDALFQRQCIPPIREALARGQHEALTAEAALLLAWEALLRAGLGPCRPAALRLLVTPTLSFEISAAEENVMRVSQQFEFSAAHRLHSPKLTAEQNLEVFGKCNNPHGHGHNYVVEVTLAGSPDPVTGEVVSIGELHRLVKSRVIQPLDHKNLDVEIDFFRGVCSTVENIATYIFQQLDGQFSPASLDAVRVYETPKTWAEARRTDTPPSRAGDRNLATKSV